MNTKTYAPAWSLAVSAMFLVQLGSALSVHLVDDLGVSGTAWLRVTFGALIFMALSRPPLRQVRRADWPVLGALGLVSGLVSITFLAAIDRIPLGTAVAIEFLGPLTVAALQASTRSALAWPALALTGVLVLTEPWNGGSIDAWGLLFAALSAVGWGLYVLLTQKLGDRFDGISGLSITVPIGALCAAPFGIPDVAGSATPMLLLAAAGIAILHPVIPFALELLALRRMTHTAFGTLMAVEPAAGLLLGAIVLSQTPTLLQGAGISLVVIAGCGAQRGGLRTEPTDTSPIPAPADHP